MYEVYEVFYYVWLMLIELILILKKILLLMNFEGYYMSWILCFYLFVYIDFRKRVLDIRRFKLNVLILFIMVWYLMVKMILKSY